MSYSAQDNNKVYIQFQEKSFEVDVFPDDTFTRLLERHVKMRKEKAQAQGLSYNINNILDFEPTVTLYKENDSQEVLPNVTRSSNVLNVLHKYSRVLSNFAISFHQPGSAGL